MGKCALGFSIHRARKVEAYLCANPSFAAEGHKAHLHCLAPTLPLASEESIVLFGELGRCG